MSTNNDTDKKKMIHEKNIDKTQSTLKKYQKEIKKLKQELKEKNDKILRILADLQNQQKRAEKEITFKEEETKKKYLSELLDLVDLLKKACEDENPKDGLRAVLTNIENFLEREQITYIECIGKKFDHNFHHAISTIEKDDCNDDEIVDEIKKGYMIEDKLLRPSQVIVAKKKEK